MAASSIITRIKDLVGDEVTSIEGYKDLINSGFNHAADLIPSDSELWRSALIESTTDLSTIKASNSKVILVTRQDSNSVDRVAKEVSLDYLKRGQDDPTSIYYNAGNYRNPIYSFEPNGDMVIKPTGGTVAIYRYVYLVETNITDETDGTDFDFPQQALNLGILKACSYLLQAKISEAVQEEEDNELFALTQGQISTIDKMIQEELQRLGLPFQLVGDGNDTK
tara:strand:- start:100 stop:768 length:669 start_codon:yes stop_codon:yes gene_type:complete